MGAVAKLQKSADIERRFYELLGAHAEHYDWTTATEQKLSNRLERLEARALDAKGEAQARGGGTP